MIFIKLPTFQELEVLIGLTHKLPETFFKLKFNPCQAEQSLKGMELKEKEAQKDLSKHEISLERIAVC